MTETFDKAAGSPDHAVQFELSNYSDNSDNSGTGSDAGKRVCVSIQFHDEAGGAFPHLVEEEDLGHCSQYPGSSQDLQDELHAAMGLIGESGENSEKLTCQPEHHTTSTKSQLNIEKLSEEIFERFSAKFQDSSIAKDIAREQGRRSWGGWGGRVPPSFFSGGGRISNYPPHFLTCLMKFCFLVI